MTYRRRPSLVALRSFEAAARHRSVTRAAGELSVTPGAVSRGVRALEEELGAPLFHRAATGLTLTPAGEALFAAAQDGLDRIAAGLVAMRQAAPRRRLRSAPTRSSPAAGSFPAGAGCAPDTPSWTSSWRPARTRWSWCPAPSTR